MMPESAWERQYPELTSDAADEVVRIIRDIRLFVEQGDILVGYNTIYLPEWDGESVPQNLSFSIPSVGIEVHIGRDGGGSKSWVDESGERQNVKYSAPVYVQISIPVKVDFIDAGRFVNLFFDGQKGEHEGRVLDEVIWLRDAYMKHLSWYFSMAKVEIPVAIEAAKSRLTVQADARRMHEGIFFPAEGTEPES